MLSAPKCPEKFYGLASSFYGNEVSVCAVVQGENEDRPQVIRDLSFVEKDQKKIHAATSRFIDTVCQVTRLQNEANLAAGCDQYPLPITIGWKGIDEIPAMKGVFPSAERVTSGFHFGGEELERIFGTLRTRINALKLQSFKFHLGQAEYQGTGKNYKHQACPYPELEAISTQAKSGHNPQATRNLVALAHREGVRIYRQLESQVGTEKIKQLAFVELPEPWYEHFNTPEAVNAIQEVLRACCKTNREFDLMFPSTPHNQRFFNVLRPFMAQQIKVLKQTIAIVRKLMSNPEFMAANAGKTIEVEVREA